MSVNRLCGTCKWPQNVFINLCVFFSYLCFSFATRHANRDVVLQLNGKVDVRRVETQLDEWSTYINPEHGKWFGGDMTTRLDTDGNRRTFLSDARTRWPNGLVPYHLDSIIENNENAKQILLNSMETITQATQNCIQFFPLTNKMIQEYDHLLYTNITGLSGGCTSDIGRVFRGGKLNLDIAHCFQMPGHSLHELLHALGQLHEHMRPDRDKFVTVLWKNIRPDALENFKAIEDDEVMSFGLPYDYDSITHYQRTAFSVNPEMATIIPKNSSQTIGQRTHLSALDVEKLKLAYNCHKPRRPRTFEDMLDTYLANPEEYIKKKPDEYSHAVAVSDDILKNDSLKFHIIKSKQSFSSQVAPTLNTPKLITKSVGWKNDNKKLPLVHPFLKKNELATSIQPNTPSGFIFSPLGNNVIHKSSPKTLCEWNKMNNVVRMVGLKHLLARPVLYSPLTLRGFNSNSAISNYYPITPYRLAQPSLNYYPKNNQQTTAYKFYIANSRN